MYMDMRHMIKVLLQKRNNLTKMDMVETQTKGGFGGV